MSRIPYYLDYLPAALLDRLWEQADPVPAVEGLRIATGVRARFPDLETDEALSFICDLYQAVRPELEQVLAQRGHDRAFIDAATLQCAEQNAGVPFLSEAYRTVLGAIDREGRVIVGRQASDLDDVQVIVPKRLEGPQVTLFGPPDSAKMAINAMNALHRKLPEEPEIVAELVESSGAVPRWGADVEDSKTPLIEDLLEACRNLKGCYEGTLAFEDSAKGRRYDLVGQGRSLPIKRIPGLALPDGNHLFEGAPLPLHLFDFALHLYHNWRREESLVFYVPKLENEEEAAYLKTMIGEAESQLKAIFPEYVSGSVRLFVVFENPRAIFRIREIANTLSPYFLGGSLGWHDFLASTARIFRHDPHYRIPVKADPNIVINHIKASHRILVESLSPLGALTIGGMYGVLYEDGNPASFMVSMVGYIKDVVTQLKRGLDGFWVAHPAFVRVGLALMESWGQHVEGDSLALKRLVEALVTDDGEREHLLAFVFGPDVQGLESSSPIYERAVLAATLQVSDVIANDDPEEVRYNVFQAIQYLADWLSGSGCVALPATLRNHSGEPVFVRVMDDLATTERSRWELWAEVHHGRVSVALFDDILAEELAFIREGRESDTKRVQVQWEGKAGRWYPIAARLLRQLVVDPDPVEFVTELLMPFTLSQIRNSDDPWQHVNLWCPHHYHP